MSPAPLCACFLSLSDYVHTHINTHAHTHSRSLFRASNVHSSSTQNSVTLEARFPLMCGVCFILSELCVSVLVYALHVISCALPLAESFLVLMILAAYSCPEDIFTHLLTTENAPLKEKNTNIYLTALVK